MDNLPNTPPEPQVVIKSSKHIPLAITLGVLLLLSLAAIVYMGHSMTSKGSIPAFSYLHELKPTPIPTPASESPWEEISFAGTTFIFPRGWHAAFSTNHADLSTLAIDPDPVHFDPQDISLSTYTIQQIPIRPGEHPEEILSKEMGQISDGYYKDISTNIIKSSIGDIHHVEATITGSYMYGKTIDKYFLLTPVKDGKQQSVLVFGFDYIVNNDYSNMLKEMVMSVK